MDPCTRAPRLPAWRPSFEPGRASACQTRTLTVSLPGQEDFILTSLADRQQYSDPGGEAAQLGISSALWPLSGLLWPSSLYLATALMSHRIEAGTRILEIGCGLALPSLACHRRGWDITASDHHPLVYRFLRQNLVLNQLPATLPYRHGDWNGTATQTPYTRHVGLLAQAFDFILGSDLLYERDAAPALAAFIHAHAEPACSVWIVDANRGGRPAFTRSMQAHGFELRENLNLNRRPCLSGARSYKGHLLKYRRA
ncbi:methyltransferase [Castellaniella sp.]|uniref:class I SAM-dependent methyltransferase n=1 Tax=Castellaniella sp. TaxID=1955812 RepID=UPI003564EB69